MYITEQLMVVYRCYGLLSDGTCHPSATFLDVFSRTTDSVSAETTRQLRDVVSAACYTQDDIVSSKHDSQYLY